MKLQPNFSWQKYEGEPEDQRTQFQKQLQTQHKTTANSINSTLDDLSFWERERQTSYTWVNGKPIWTLTQLMTPWQAPAFTVSTTILNITPLPAPALGGLGVINFFCCISDGQLTSSNSLILPHIDPGVPANEISIVRNGLGINIISAGTNRSAYTGYITIYYYKT